MSERLADHVVSTRFEDLPREVVEKTKDLLTYHLALALAGGDEERGRAIIALAHELSAGGGRSTIIGERRPATVLDAVLANGELIDKSRDAAHLASKLTLGRVVDPVAWVIGEHRHASGRELITSVVVGYDAAAALASPQPMRTGGYTRVPHKCAFAPFGAAAVAARLLGHDRARTARVLGRAAHYGMGLNTGLEHSYAFSAIARSAVLAALVPETPESALLQTIEGSHGMYAALFDGPPDGLEASIGELGRRYAIVDAAPRPHPGSASHLAALDAMRALVDGHGQDPDSVERIVVTLPEEFRGRFEYQESMLDRAREAADREAAVKRSLRLKLAILLLDRVVVPEPTLAHYDDHRVQAVLPCIRLAFAPVPIDRASVEIATRAGESAKAEGVVAASSTGVGSAWLRAQAGRTLSAGELSRLEQSLAHLEDVPDVAEVLATTVPAASDG